MTNPAGYLGSADGQILRVLDIITMTRTPTGTCRLNRNAVAEIVQALNNAHRNIEEAASRLPAQQA